MDFYFFHWGTTAIKGRYVVIPQGWLKLHHLLIGCTQRKEDADKLYQLRPRVHGEYLAIQLFWVTVKLLVTHIGPIYVVDKVIFLFLVSLKEMRLMDEYKIISFLVLVLIKGMKICGESKISMCILRVGKLLMRPPASVVV